MNIELKKLIDILSASVKAKLSPKIKEIYYKKMNYSNINLIADTDTDILNKTISFEIAFIHVSMYIFCKSRKIVTFSYNEILKLLDADNLFSWYEIEEKFIEEHLDKLDIKKYSNIYSLINLHDTMIEKDIKKKFGQFYTPIYVVKQMLKEINSSINKINMCDKICDPACGTGVFLVEVLNKLKFTLDEKLIYLSENIYGYDVNPFAVIATKINLMYSLILSEKNITEKKIVEIIFDSKKLFKNIKWTNTITEVDVNLYSIIIGNPPYFKLNNELVKELNEYREIMYGQTNIYSLFTCWALNHLKLKGILCFILPQSIRSGLYFKKLRLKISKVKIKSIIQLSSRKKIFDRAEQAVSIICLENQKVRNTKTKIQFYDINNKNIINKFKIDNSKLMMGESFNNIFIINNNLELYTIFETVYENSIRMNSDDSNLKFSNGLFVWNQHKEDIICMDKEKLSAPIIYGGNIQNLKLDFEKNLNNKEKKQFSMLNKKTRRYLLSGKKLLIQRTTNFDSKMRIKSCLINDEFSKKYSGYFLENHINYLCFKNDKNRSIQEDDLYYYLAILNSKLLNYIFTSISGNTQVSANELNELPFPNEKNIEVSNLMRKYMESSINKDYVQSELNMLICSLYGLSEKQSNYLMGI